MLLKTSTVGYMGASLPHHWVSAAVSPIQNRMFPPGFWQIDSWAGGGGGPIEKTRPSPARPSPTRPSPTRPKPSRPSTPLPGVSQIIINLFKAPTIFLLKSTVCHEIFEPHFFRYSIMGLLKTVKQNPKNFRIWFRVCGDIRTQSWNQFWVHGICRNKILA